MLNLSKINSETSKVEKKRKARKSIQNDFIAHALNSKKRKFTAPEILAFVQNYTLEDPNQKWYDTKAKFDGFVNDVEKVNNDKLTPLQFKAKHQTFLDAMSTKTYDLFLSPSHPRSFASNKADNKWLDRVSVDVENQIVTIK